MDDIENTGPDKPDFKKELNSSVDDMRDAGNTIGNETSTVRTATATDPAIDSVTETADTDTNANASHVSTKSRIVRERKPRKPRKPYRFAKARRIFWTLVLLWVIAYCINWYFVERRLYTPTKWGAFHKLAVFTYYEGDKMTVPGSNPKLYKWVFAEAQIIFPFAISNFSAYLADEDSFGDKLLKLDRRYGDIPEYWEMRPAGSGMNRLDCLQKALSLNPGCPDLVYFHSVLGSKGLGLTDESQWKPEYDELALNGARKAAEMEPDNGAWNFLQFVELNNLGEWDEAVEQLKIASNAPKFRLPGLFPAREYLNTLYDLRKNPQVATLGFGFIDYSFNESHSPGIHIHDSISNSLVAIAMNGDLDSLNLLFRCTIRLSEDKVEFFNPGLRRITVTNYTVRSLGEIRSIVNWFRDEYGDDLSESDSIALSYIKDKSSIINSVYKSPLPNNAFSYPVFNYFPDVNPYDDMFFDKQIEDAPDNLSASETCALLTGLGRAWLVRYDTIREYCDFYAVEASYISKLMKENISPLSEFDFNCPAESLERVFEKSNELRQNAQSLDSSPDKDDTVKPLDESGDVIKESETDA